MLSVSLTILPLQGSSAHSCMHSRVEPHPDDRGRQVASLMSGHGSCLVAAARCGSKAEFSLLLHVVKWHRDDVIQCQY